MRPYEGATKNELFLNVLHKARPSIVQCGPDFITKKEFLQYGFPSTFFKNKIAFRLRFFLMQG